MSLFSSMRTSVSGMSAQSNALSAISDNIANASTTGYKEASTEFETILGQEATSSYESGGVQTDVRYGIDTQGTLVTTTSSTDLAINGNGFFVVSKGGDGQYLTRAGSFVPNSDGTLINSAGYELMGYASDGKGGYDTSKLVPVTIPTSTLPPVASTSGTVSANLPSTATAVTGDTPAANAADSTYNDKTSVTIYGSDGTPTTLDVYLTKTGDGTWTANAFNQADSTSGGFPYGAAGSAPLGSLNLTFNASGQLTSSPATLSVTLANGQNVKLDMSGTTQYASGFSVSATANGSPTSKVSSVAIGTDGTVTAVYSTGAKVNVFEVPLATVASANNLTPLSGNVYQTNNLSGNIQTQPAGTGETGSIQADTLEQSTVDIATELTNMIVAQRAYEANSKVLQTASDLLGVIDRLTVS